MNWVDPFGLTSLEEWIARAGLFLGKLMYKVFPLPLLNPDLADFVGKTNPILVSLEFLLHPETLGEHGEGDFDGDGTPDFLDKDSPYYKNHNPLPGMDDLPDPGDLPELGDLPDPEEDKGPCK